MGLFSNIGEFLFGHGPDVEGAQSQLADASQQAQSTVSASQAPALQQLQMGLSDASSTLQPAIGQGNELSSELQNLLMGNTQMSEIPGYNAMSNARREAVGDLGTGMAGTGKFFSGTTAERAGDIGGAMQNQLMQQRIQSLMMGAQPGNQATSQLAGMQMGAGTVGANIPLSIANSIAGMQMGAGTNAANITMADQTEGAIGDILGAVGTIGGAVAGRPPAAPGVA
jgi:hypothetical protein